MVLRAKAPTARDVEARLEDVAAHVLSARRRQTVATLQIQHRFQDRPLPSECRHVLCQKIVILFHRMSG